MRRFRFSLETVLKVRRQVEELRQQELAVAQAARDKVLAALGVGEKALAVLNEEQSGRRKGSLDLNHETWFQSRHQGLAQEIARSRAELRDKEALLEEARVKAVEAARERKVLEKLEEQQRLAHELKENREEQGFMDELAQHSNSAMKLSSPSAGA